MLVVLVIHVVVRRHVAIVRISTNRHAIRVVIHLLHGDHMRRLRLRVHCLPLRGLLTGELLLLQLIVLGGHEVRTLLCHARCCHASVGTAWLLMRSQWHHVADNTSLRRIIVDSRTVLVAELMAVDLMLGHGTELLNGLIAAGSVVAAARTVAGTRTGHHCIGVAGPVSTALALLHLWLRCSYWPRADHNTLNSTSGVIRRCRRHLSIGAELRFDGQQLLARGRRHVHLTAPPHGIHSICLYARKHVVHAEYRVLILLCVLRYVMQIRAVIQKNLQCTTETRIRPNVIT